MFFLVKQVFYLLIFKILVCVPKQFFYQLLFKTLYALLYKLSIGLIETCKI